MKKLFGKEYIQKEFTKINMILKEKVNLYMLGGGAMSFQKLKDATKDVDVVLTDKKAFNSLSDILHKSGYTDVMVKGPYERMNPSRVLENSDGFRFDMFIKQVCNGLLLSKAIIDRSTKIISFENVDIFTVAPEDVFIFKSITSRERDREDMNTLFHHGLDFDVIRKEILWQSKHSKNRAWLAFFYVGLEEIKVMFSLDIPYFDDFYVLACDEVLQHNILLLLEEKPRTINDIVKKIGEDKNWIMRNIKRMIRKGLVVLDEDTVRLSGKSMGDK